MLIVTHSLFDFILLVVWEQLACGEDYKNYYDL